MVYAIVECVATAALATVKLMLAAAAAVAEHSLNLHVEFATICCSVIATGSVECVHDCQSSLLLEVTFAAIAHV